MSILGWLATLFTGYDIASHHFKQKEVDRKLAHRAANPHLYNTLTDKRHDLLNPGDLSLPVQMERDALIKHETDLDPYILRSAVAQNYPNMSSIECSNLAYRIFYSYRTKIKPTSFGIKQMDYDFIMNQYRGLKKILQCVLFDFTHNSLAIFDKDITMEDAQKDPEAILSVRSLYYKRNSSYRDEWNIVGEESGIKHFLPRENLNSSECKLLREIVSSQQTIISREDNFSEMVLRAESEKKQYREAINELGINTIEDIHKQEHIDLLYLRYKWHHPKAIVDEYMDYAHNFKNRPETKHITFLPYDRSYHNSTDIGRRYAIPGDVEVTKNHFTHIDAVIMDGIFNLYAWPEHYDVYEMPKPRNPYVPSNPEPSMREKILRLEYPLDFYDWCWTRDNMLSDEDILYSCDDFGDWNYRGEMFGFYALRKFMCRLYSQEFVC